MSEDNIPILCVSLTRAHERRKKIHQLWIQERQCNVEFIDAIDRRDVLSGSVEYVEPAPTPRRRNLSAGEIACSLSHAKAIQTAKERGYARCIIIEDDVIPLFNNPQQLNEIINYHDQEFPCSKIALLFKDLNSNTTRLVKHTVNKYFSSLSRAPWGSYCYAVKYDEYDRLHGFFSSLIWPADWYWSYEYAKNQSIALVNEPLAVHEGLTTYIGNDFNRPTREFLK
jgi:GR25 family glycosyltransferase involved in LPS biosynthesis